MDIEKLECIINEGKLALVPTDTVYGIIADATNIDAINKVFIAKNRDYHKPLIILVSSIEMLKRYILELNELEEKIIKKFWPGRLTVLFKKNKLIDDLVTSSSPLVGIRMPDDKNLLTLIKEIDKPIIATSANVSTKNVITNIELLDENVLKHIDYVYDIGTMSDVTSTIIKVENDKIVFLRDGLLTDAIKKEFTSRWRYF